MTSTKQRLSLHLASHEWTEALSRALESRRFASLSAYADSRPEASLAELAADLGGPDAAPIALEQRLIAEAEATGTMERCARSLLARDLRQELSEGWPERTDSDDETASQAFRLAGVFLALATSLPAAYQGAIDRVERAMKTAELPVGWLPDGPDDPALIELFASCWHAPPL